MVKFVIDTSVWIETFRPGGDKSLGDLVKQLIRSGRVLLPDIIKTELLRGAKTLAEFERLEDLLEGLTYLPLNESFWDELAAFSFNLFRKGLTVPLKVLEPVAPKTCSRPGWGHTPLNPRSVFIDQVRFLQISRRKTRTHADESKLHLDFSEHFRTNTAIIILTFNIYRRGAEIAENIHLYCSSGFLSYNLPYRASTSACDFHHSFRFHSHEHLFG